MRCIFSCLGDKKSRRKRISIPSKDQDYEIIKPLTVEGEKTKLPVIHSQEKHDDHLNGVMKEGATTDFTKENLGSESFSKAKNEEKQKTVQKPNQIYQAHSDSSMSSLFSYPINNRNKNSPSTDDDHGFVQQESSDSLFSISVNSKRQSEPGEKEVNSPMKIREWSKKEKKIVQLNWSGLNPIEKITRSNMGNLEKLIIMDDQEEKDNVKEDQETSLPFNSEDPIFKQRLNFSDAKKETEIIMLDQRTKIECITKTIENITQSSAGKLGDLILMDEQEDKENIKSDKKIFEKRSNFSDENKITGSNHGVKTISLLNPIENLTQLKTGDSGKFILMDDQKEKEKIVEDQENRVPFTCCQEPSLKNSSKFSKTKVKEILVDTSLSSWLVESERESDSPTSVKNSPDRKNNPLRRYSNDNTLNEKDMPIVGTIGSFLESNSMQTPQARTNKLKV